MFVEWEDGGFGDDGGGCVGRLEEGEGERVYVLSEEVDGVACVRRYGLAGAEDGGPVVQEVGVHC